MKLFADDTSLLSIVNCVNILLQHSIMHWWSYKIVHTNGKYHFSLKKETSSRCLILSKNQINYSLLVFDKFDVKLASIQKHIRLNLDSKLSFNEHIAGKKNKTMTCIVLPRKITIYFTTLVLNNHMQSFYTTLSNKLVFSRTE